MNSADTKIQFPSNYGVVLIPGMFPGGLNEFEPLIREYGMKAHQIIDGSYNMPEYYVNNNFSLEVYGESVNKKINEVKKYCDKVISISLSYGGLISFLLNEKISLDGSLYISPISTNEGMDPKYERRFVDSLLGEEVKCLPIWVKFFKMYGYNEKFFYYMADFLKLRLKLIREFDVSRFKKEKIHCNKPTVFYFAENERDFLKWDESHESAKQMSDVEKILRELIDLFTDKENASIWSEHSGINIEKSVNFTPLESATGNYSVMTSMSHPKLFLGHCDFNSHLNPYTIVLKYLIDAVENNIDVAKDTKYSPGHVLWKYIFGMIHSNTYAPSSEAFLKRSNNVIRIDEKENFTNSDIITSFQEYWMSLKEDKKKEYTNLISKALQKNKQDLSDTLVKILDIIKK